MCHSPWQTVNKLLHRKSSPLPSSAPGMSLVDSFASFFSDKISKLRLSLGSNPTCHLHTYLVFSPLSPLPLNLKSINPFKLPNRQSDSDPSPIWLLKEYAYVLVPTITKIVNLSLTSGQFHPILKESVISALLKKSTLDKDQLSNYHPVSNFSLISRIIEHVVKSDLTDHLTSNKLLNPHQSAYCTSTIISSVQPDHNSCHAHNLSCLSLLDLLLPLTPSTIASYSPAFHLGSAATALSSTGSSLTCHLTPSVSDVITLSSPCIHPPVVFCRAPFFVLCFSSCTPPPSVLASPPFPSTTTFMQMTPNCFYHFTHPTSTQALPTYKTPFSKSLPGCLQIS